MPFESIGLRMLNDFAERFADLLFAQYPTWRDSAQSDPGRTQSTSLVVQVPCPNPRVVGDLLITTEGGEVTIYLDRYHNHFMQNEEQAFESALDFIARLLSEELVVLVYMEGDKWAGSRCVGLNDPWPRPAPGQQRYLRSWLGTLDSEMHGTES
jgi:hypothetical protein